MSTFDYLGGVVSKSMSDFMAGIPGSYSNFFEIGLFVYLFISSVFFIWIFSKILTNKEFISPSPYYDGDNPVVHKMLKWFFIGLEFTVILPILVTFWFYFFASFLLFIPGLSVDLAILLTFLLVVCIRVFCYFDEEKALYFTRSVGAFIFLVFMIGYFFVDVSGKGEALLYLIVNIRDFLIYFFLIIFFEILLRIGFYLKDEYLSS